MAEDFYKGSVEPGLIKRKKIYDAPKEFYRKKFPNLSELSDWISRDVKTTIDWMLPSIMEVFIGTDDPCDIQGQNLDDDVAAKKLQSVVKYQINKKNDYFRFLYSFIKEGLITNLGVAQSNICRPDEGVLPSVIPHPPDYRALHVWRWSWHRRHS